MLSAKCKKIGIGHSQSLNRISLSYRKIGRATLKKGFVHRHCWLYSKAWNFIEPCRIRSLKRSIIVGCKSSKEGLISAIMAIKVLLRNIFGLYSCSGFLVFRMAVLWRTEGRKRGDFGAIFNPSGHV